MDKHSVKVISKINVSALIPYSQSLSQIFSFPSSVVYPKNHQFLHQNVQRDKDSGKAEKKTLSNQPTNQTKSKITIKKRKNTSNL